MGEKSGMTGDCHVPFRGSPGLRCPGRPGACANRVVEPRSKLAFADWWATTAADRWVRLPAAALDHRRFWDAMHAVDGDALAEVERRLAVAMAGEFDLGLSGMALDMTNFATFI